MSVRASWQQEMRLPRGGGTSAELTSHEIETEENPIQMDGGKVAERSLGLEGAADGRRDDHKG